VTIFGKRQVGTTLILALVIATSLFLFQGLASLSWPFATPSPLSLNPQVPPPNKMGSLRISATYIMNGNRSPIAGGGISVYIFPSDKLLYANQTDVNGSILYALPSGSYFVAINSKQGDGRTVVDVHSGNTTVLNYVSINQTTQAISFDVVTQQPGYAAPWDSIYVEMPVSNELNASSAVTFIRPLYLGTTNSSSSPINQFFRKNLTPAPFEVQVEVNSQEFSASNVSWLGMMPKSTFPLTGVLGIEVLEYNSTFTSTTIRGIST
jgi:hypothetical protein